MAIARREDRAPCPETAMSDLAAAAGRPLLVADATDVNHTAGGIRVGTGPRRGTAGLHVQEACVGYCSGSGNDLIIMDLQMPEMRWMRDEDHPDECSYGYPHRYDGHGPCRKQGVALSRIDDYMTKPFDFKSLSSNDQ